MKNLENYSPYLDTLETLHKNGGVPRYFFRNLVAEPRTDFLEKDRHAHRLETAGIMTTILSFIVCFILVTYPTMNEMTGYTLPLAVTIVILIVSIISAILSYRGQKLRKESRALRETLASLESILQKEQVDISSLHSESTDDEVRMWADETLTRLATEILLVEIPELSTDKERLRMSQVAVRLSQFGLGREWNVYFEAAKERIDPYALFTWQI